MVREDEGFALPISGAPVAVRAEVSTLKQDRRLEDWIVENLDGATGSRTPGELSVFALRKKVEERTLESSRHSDQPGGWNRIRFQRRGEILSVKLNDTSLVKESQILELAQELKALLDARWSRIVLDFGAVERMSSQMVGVLVEVARRCDKVEGGQFRFCRLRPEVAQVFTLAGVEHYLTVFPREAEALQAPWPPASQLRPLPVELLRAVESRNADARADQYGVGESEEVTPTPLELDDPEPFALRLVILTGRNHGRSIPIDAEGLRIGRDPSCRVRSECPTLSRVHVEVVRLDGRVYVRDLGSTNGTYLNDAWFQGERREVRTGDQLRIGPLSFTFEADQDEPMPIEERVSDWIAPTPREEPATLAEHSAFDNSTDEVEPLETDASPFFRREVVEDVLVLTPRLAILDESIDLDPLRDELRGHLEQPLPRQVVLNFKPLMHLSSRAIGIILAHRMALDRLGGGVRICEVPPRLALSLEAVRLHLLVEFFPTLDEAVLAPWPQADSA